MPPVPLCTLLNAHVTISFLLGFFRLEPCSPCPLIQGTRLHLIIRQARSSAVLGCLPGCAQLLLQLLSPMALQPGRIASLAQLSGCLLNSSWRCLGAVHVSVFYIRPVEFVNTNLQAKSLTPQLLSSVNYQAGLGQRENAGPTSIKSHEYSNDHFAAACDSLILQLPNLNSPKLQQPYLVITEFSKD
jgi:hypothetical protein